MLALQDPPVSNNRKHSIRRDRKLEVPSWSKYQKALEIWDSIVTAANTCVAEAPKRRENFFGMSR